MLSRRLWFLEFLVLISTTYSWCSHRPARRSTSSWVRRGDRNYRVLKNDACINLSTLFSKLLDNEEQLHKNDCRNSFWPEDSKDVREIFSKMIQPQQQKPNRPALSVASSSQEPSNIDWSRRALSFSLTCLAVALVSFCAISEQSAAAFPISSSPLMSTAEPTRSSLVLPSLSPLADQTSLVSTSGVGSTTTRLASMRPATTTTTKASSNEYSMLDEVWNLINKYYFDPTFGGQDWDQVHDKYRHLLLQQKQKSIKIDDKEEYQLTTNMVKLLHDKYTRLLDSTAYAAIQKYDLIGVGVTLMPNPVSKQIQVGAPPVPHSPADVMGLHVGDFVDAVNGVPTSGRTAFDIIDQLSATTTATPSDVTQYKNNEDNDKNDSTLSTSTQNIAKTVTMTIRRPAAMPDDQEIIFDVTMERQFQKVSDPIRYKVTETRTLSTVGKVDKSNDQNNNKAVKIGWVRISEFNSLVKTQLENAVRDLHEQGVNAYILDVRHNTGGAFQSAVEIASLFLDPGQVATYVVDRNQAKMPFYTTSTASATSKIDEQNLRKGNNGPIIPRSDLMVIWTDGSSASASEVLAAALRDNCRAVVMGDNSFGKGLIQGVYGLGNGSGLVLTVARYVTPNGNDIQGVGISPDILGHMPAYSLFDTLGIGGESISDTTQVDFDDVAERLALCQPPAKIL